MIFYWHILALIRHFHLINETLALGIVVEVLKAINFLLRDL